MGYSYKTWDQNDQGMVELAFSKLLLLSFYVVWIFRVLLESFVFF